MKTTTLAIAAAMATGGAAHAQEAVFVTVPLGNLANVRLEDAPLAGYSAPLDALDPLVLSGVPFAHPSGPWAWNSHAAAAAGQPTSIVLDIGGLRANTIHTQLNTYWGTASGTSGIIEIAFDDGSSAQFELIGNYNVRDYNNARYTNELTAPNSSTVFEWSSYRMDIQSWVFPTTPGAGIASMTIRDLGGDNVSRLILGGVTLEFSADCNGDGIVDYGQILDGTFADKNGNGVPDTCECLADVNQDGVVNGADISAVLGFWGQAGKPLPAADITRDGLVDGADIAVLLGSWGPCQ